MNDLPARLPQQSHASHAEVRSSLQERPGTTRASNAVPTGGGSRLIHLFRQLGLGVVSPFVSLNPAPKARETTADKDGGADPSGSRCRHGLGRHLQQRKHDARRSEIGMPCRYAGNCELGRRPGRPRGRVLQGQDDIRDRADQNSCRPRWIYSVGECLDCLSR